jgi:hypothetical protein
VQSSTLGLINAEIEREFQHQEEGKKQAIKFLDIFMRMANNDPEWGVQKPD